MSHNTTSWKSHSSTWRWTAGNDGRSPEGGKARRVGRHPALARQKAIGEHDQRQVSMQPIPAPPLVMVQAAFALGVLIELLDGPAAVGHPNEAGEWRFRRQGTEVPLEVAACAWHRALAEQPALWSRTDTVMTGGELRAPGGPVHAHRRELFAADHCVVFAPGDRLPTVLRQGREDRPGLIERRRAWLLRLAKASRPRRQAKRGGAHLRGEADPKGAAD